MDEQQRTDDAGQCLHQLMMQRFNYNHDAAMIFTDFIFNLIDARVQQELAKHIKEQHDVQGS